MSIEIKYRHPFNHDLDWSGRGKAPKWYDHALENGLTEEALRVESQNVVVSGDSDIDLGIGDVSVSNIVSADGRTGSPMVRVDDLAARVGVLTRNTDELLVIAADALNTVAVSFVRAGVAFLMVQENFRQSTQVDSGKSEAFIDWIEQQGIPKQRVYESIAAAKFVMRLPSAEIDKVISVGKTKLKLLASLPQEVIDQAAESGNDLIEKADCMTVAELREEIRAMQRREKNYEAELERKDSLVKRLSEAKKRTTDFLLRTEELREECMALQLGAELPLNSLRRLFDDTEISGSEGFLQAETIWIAVNAIAARALDIIQHIRDCGPESLPDRPQAKHLLGPEEAARWLADYPLIENRFEGEKALRESRREAARPRGPGRPKGSGSKAGEE